MTPQDARYNSLTRNTLTDVRQQPERINTDHARVGDLSYDERRAVIEVMKAEAKRDSR